MKKRIKTETDINNNVDKLLSKDLFDALFKESIGGNAGENKAVVNAIVNRKNGYIIGFSNLPLDEYLARNNIKGENYVFIGIVYDMTYVNPINAIRTDTFYPKIVRIDGPDDVKEKISVAVKKANEQYKLKYEKTIKESYEAIYSKIKSLLENGFK